MTNFDEQLDFGKMNTRGIGDRHSRYLGAGKRHSLRAQWRGNRAGSGGSSRSRGVLVVCEGTQGRTQV